jgi:hypothetical protein
MTCSAVCIWGGGGLTAGWRKEGRAGHSPLEAPGFIELLNYSRRHRVAYRRAIWGCDGTRTCRFHLKHPSGVEGGRRSGWLGWLGWYLERHIVPEPLRSGWARFSWNMPIEKRLNAVWLYYRRQLRLWRCQRRRVGGLWVIQGCSIRDDRLQRSSLL